MRLVSQVFWLSAAVALCVQPARGQTPSKGAIAGVVVDASTGQGISGARVRLQAGQEDPQFAIAGEQGRFQFAGLDLGAYDVTARFPGFIAAREGDGELPRTRPFLNLNRPSVSVRLEMRRYGVIVGKVTNSLGLPVEGVRVTEFQRYPLGQRASGYAYNDENYQYAGRHFAVTDDLGEYRLAPLGAGSYYIYVQPGSYTGQSAMRPIDPRERATFYPHALKPSETKPLDLAEGKELRADVQIVRQGGVTVTGRIFGAQEHPDWLLSVFFRPLSAGTSIVPVNLTGDRFTAADLLPGEYLVEASQYAAGDFGNQTPSAGARRTIDIGTDDVDRVDLTLAPTPDLAGTVVFEGGCPAVPVLVSLQGDLGLPQDRHVDVDGQFLWQHLLPGDYKVYARPEGLSNAVAASAKLGDAEVLAGGFEVTAETKGPLRIAMSCARR